MSNTMSRLDDQICAPRRRRHLLAVLATLVSPAGGCGDEGGGHADASTSVDASAVVDASVDAGSGVCPGALASYPGVLHEVTATEGNPDLVSGHFLALNADLDLSARPDSLNIVAFYQIGVETGTFELPGGNWVVTLCLDREGASCQSGGLEVASGTLTIDSVEGFLTGSLQNATFVDDREARPARRLSSMPTSRLP